METRTGDISGLSGGSVAARMITLNEVGADTPRWKLNLNAHPCGPRHPVIETLRWNSVEDWYYVKAGLGRCRRCPAVPAAMTSRCCRPAHVACLVSGMISGVLWPPRAGGASAAGSTLARMGLIEALAYEVPEPNAAQRAMWHVSSSRPGAWLFAKSGPHLDGFLLRLSKGQVTLATLVAGIPVITIVTTGARTGRTRTTPLLGVPFAGDLAVIGTRFGQKGTPGWYYNLRANPAIQVIYRDKSAAAAAREVQGEERQAIWQRARQIYGGYDAYARRIKDRQIHIMLLSMRVTSASDTG